MSEAAVADIPAVGFKSHPFTDEDAKVLKEWPSGIYAFDQHDLRHVPGVATEFATGAHYLVLLDPGFHPKLYSLESLLWGGPYRSSPKLTLPILPADFADVWPDTSCFAWCEGATGRMYASLGRVVMNDRQFCHDALLFLPLDGPDEGRLYVQTLLSCAPALKAASPQDAIPRAELLKRLRFPH